MQEYSFSTFAYEKKCFCSSSSEAFKRIGTIIREAFGFDNKQKTVTSKVSPTSKARGECSNISYTDIHRHICVVNLI